MAQILVVDDDYNIIEVVEMYLEGLGHKVTSFNSAEEGLEWSRGHKVDLLITDILMPGMNGLELISDFKELHPNEKILAISGGGESGGIVKDIALETAVELGAEGALPKPFTKSELLKRVDRLLSS